MTDSGGIWKEFGRNLKKFEGIWKKDGIWRNLVGIWRNLKEFEGIWKKFEGIWRNLTEFGRDLEGIWKEFEGIWRNLKGIWKEVGKNLKEFGKTLDGIWRNSGGIWKEFGRIWRNLEGLWTIWKEFVGILRNLGAARQGPGRHLFALKRRLSGVSHRSAPHHPATRPVPPAWPTTMASCFGLVIPSPLDVTNFGAIKATWFQTIPKDTFAINFALAFQYGMYWGSQSVVTPSGAT